MSKKPTSQLTKLMAATIQCSAESAQYGQCVLRNYENINKDVCLKEFELYKNCVQKHLGRKW